MVKICALFLSLGLVLAGKRRGLLAEIKSCLDSLLQHGFYIAPQLYKKVLTDAGVNSKLSARQNRYATLLALPTVYTPQIVVDGKWQAVGSDRADVEQALDRARRDRPEVPVTLALDHGQAQIALGPGSDGVAASVTLIGFDRRHVTAVKRGENSGRTLAHVDVVRGFDEIARLSAGEIAVPIPWHCDLVAAVVQTADGRVLGVAVRDAEPL